MSDGKHGIFATTLIAFAVAGAALGASLFLSYLAMPPRGRSVVRKALEREQSGGPASQL